MRSAEVVLVHGLYHQPAHLQPLADALRRRGVSVHAPRLHRGSLAADTVAVQEAIDVCGDPPVVVAHSYGGAVASGTEGASSFVFMAAFVPDLGESCASLGGPDAPVNAWVRPHPEGGTYIPKDAATDLFYGDCEPEAAQRAVELLIPQASGHGRCVVSNAAWKYAPSHYVICARDRAMNPVLQQAMASRCGTEEVIDASHSPYISHVEAVMRSILG
ncbi:alpha/beta hydrolase [Agromyces albus]|uniref:alpha/beta hydrolase n=1 Tax=Agromyces albus TaxID=205332 RepID=UPI00358E039E